MKLPKTFRSEARTRPVQEGIDFPSWFLDDMKAVDERLHLVWHPWRVMYDEHMNTYAGRIEDPRFTIGEQAQYGGEEIWGFVLTDGSGHPIPENHWHCWRLSEMGWCHVTRMEEPSRAFLAFFLDRLQLQSYITGKYGPRAWARFEWDEKEQRESAGLEKMDLEFKDVLHENKRIMEEVRENWKSGVVASTDPRKDVIISYPGQTNRSGYSRPLDDEEGGFIVPPTWS